MPSPTRRALALAAALCAGLACSLVLAPAAQAAAGPDVAQPAAAPAGTTTTLAVPDHATDGTHLVGTVTVTAADPTALLDGTVQLSVDGTPVGDPVPVVETDGVGSAPVDVAVSGPGVHTLGASFSGPAASPSSASVSFTVVPASLPWQLTYADGSPATGELTGFDLVARGSGQVPGSTVLVEATLDGEWLWAGEGVAGKDGTFEIPALLAFPGFEPEPMDVRTQVETAWGDVVGAPTRIVVPAVDFPVQLEVDPGPYRADDAAHGRVLITLSWLGLDVPLATPDELDDLIAEGSVQVLLDGHALPPSDITTSPADGDWTGLWIAVPRTAGTHTVQVRFVVPELSVDSSSPVRTFAVTPSTFSLQASVDGMTVDSAAAGTGLDLVAAGLLPGTTLAFTLDGEPVGTATVGAASGSPGAAAATGLGSAVVHVTVPADAWSGAHALVATATDPLGDTVTASAFLTVTGGPVLAVTGSDPGLLSALGATCVLAGLTLVLAGRRRLATLR